MKYNKNIINKYMSNNLPASGNKPGILSRAIRYSVLNGGKRLRPLLCLAAFQAAGGRGKLILPVAGAVELIHAFSLVHDDLPAMDNDDYRRGKLTVHKNFGEDIAILTGDALLNLAFDWVSAAPGLTAQKKLSIIKELVQATGSQGLIGGQVLDLKASAKKTPAAKVKDIHLLKTTALITAAVRTGAITAGTTKSQLKKLTTYGNNLGLAFQLTDDLLDLEQDKKNKLQISYPLLFGRKKTIDYARKLYRQATRPLSSFGKKAASLTEIADLVIQRIPK